MKEILEANGWKIYSSCFCGGTPKHYFKKNDDTRIIIIAPKKNTFYVKRSNRLVHTALNTTLANYLYENPKVNI